MANEQAISTVSGGSCEALTALRVDVDAFMADLLDAALVIKEERGFASNAEAFDYLASFLSGMYRGLAMLARDATIGAME